ncbi:hypothetical protein Alches_12310 [Alicyclobacillus hesperidum subsp. aegles]|uniref:hypothetical protein n=1 Tax=Alicyclobacillus hesperidum TaxID=89784 RepID=UPI00222A417F|nr:hypothetical protein [Alicyclobacillus hesperidum]GLG01192.1 hypothetical protein Alches_12310 [Alicyclobacillus hesperidum subsp. aegles]
MIGLKITPDRRVSNDGVETFAAALHDLSKTVLERVQLSGWRFKMQRQRYVIWEWHITADDAQLIAWMPSDVQSIVEQHIHASWPRATVETAKDDPLSDWSGEVTGANIVLKEHYMYSLGVDHRALAPLPSILETMRMLREGERGVIQIHMVPAPKDWYLGAQTAYERMKDGIKPRRRSFRGRAIAETAAKAMAAVALHTTAFVAEVITGEQTEPEPVDPPGRLVGEREVSRHTIQKAKYVAFDVSIRVAATSPDSGRQDAILRALGTAFRDLEGDNTLVMSRPRNPVKWWEEVRHRKQPTIKLNPDYLSIPEVARLLQLPSGALQEEYGLTAVKHQEFDLPENILQGGIRFGIHTWRGNETPVYMPTENWDDLCLPRVVIGGMGTGKTRGFGGNWGAQAVAQGYSVISIDVAKDELGDEICAGARYLGVKPEKLIRLEFGQRAYRLDWVEAEGARNAANRLAGEAVNFFRLHGAEAGVETGRYIRLAGKTVGVIRGSLVDMVHLFTDAEYRMTVIKRLRATRPDLAREWDTYDALSPGMKGKVTDPVLNRLDLLLGDDYLRECLEATNGIDFRRWMTGGYHVAIHVPKAELGSEATDMLVDMLMSKIELAMLARPESKQRPCFVICDEPHQFASCAPRWERMAVESRKWRVGLVWMFHSFEQIPRSLAHRIKDAGCHYHLYTSSKRTYMELAEEIAPFTIEEALKTPKHWSITLLRAGTDPIRPFMVKMDPPPMRREVMSPNL